MKERINTLSHPTSLNTLAQNGTNSTEDALNKNQIVVSGIGTNMGDDRSVKKRAKAKTITNAVVLSILKYEDSIHSSDKKKYWNTYYCQRTVYSENGKLHGSYCKNRLCLLCNNIRKALLIRNYLPVIETWNEPYFVTLTVTSVIANKLTEKIRELNAVITRIVSKYRKRFQRGLCNKLVGIKSIECTFNPVTKKYHPHIHLVVSDRKTADIFINEWLQMFNNRQSFKKHQHKQKIKSGVDDLLNILKYGFKTFTEFDLSTNKNSKKIQMDFVPESILTILNAMKRRRIVDRFGFNLPKNKNNKESKTQILHNPEKWVFDIKETDWLNTETEIPLSGYQPASDVVKFLNSYFGDN